MPPIDQKCVQDLCERERYKFLIVLCAHASRMRIMQQDLFDNHKNEFIKNIIEIYLNLCLFLEVKRRYETKSKNVKHKYKKLIYFKHQ